MRFRAALRDWRRGLPVTVDHDVRVPVGYKIEVRPVETLAGVWRYRRVVYRHGVEIPLGLRAETFTDTREEGIDAAILEAFDDRDSQAQRRAEKKNSGTTILIGKEPGERTP